MADNLPDVYLKFIGADPEIRGESMDAAYPADQGWLAIQSFNFGFGWGGSGGSAGSLDELKKQLVKEDDPQRRVQLQAKITALEKQQNQAGGSAKNAAGKQAGKDAKKEEGAQLKQKEFRFARAPGRASKDLLLNLQKGPNKGLEVELIVCRAAGVDIPNGAAKDAKIPFLKFTFSAVQLTKCSMSIGKDQPVSEDVQFWFDQVKMETIWTDNETGEKLPGGKNTISFDFGNKDSEPQFEGFLDVD